MNTANWRLVILTACFITLAVFMGFPPTGRHLERSDLLYYHEQDGVPWPGYRCDRIVRELGIDEHLVFFVVGCWAGTIVLAPKIYARFR